MAALAVVPDASTSELMIPAQTEKTAIVQLFEAGGLDSIVDRIRAEVESHDSDISTEKGRKAVASLAYKVSRSKTTLDDLGKNLVADKKAEIATVDAERKKMRDALDDLRDRARQPLTDWENAEKARLQAHEDALEAIYQLSTRGCGQTVDGVRSLMDQVRAYESRDWQEFAKRAAEVRGNVLYVLSGSLEDAERRERERVEAERTETERVARIQAEREERIRQEAAAKAKADAEAEAARQAKEAAAKVERERQAAEQARLQAERKAEQERRAAEDAKRVAEQRALAAEAAATRAKADAERAVAQEKERAAEESKRQRDAEEKREANKRHVAAVNGGIVAKLVMLGVNADTAKVVVIAMAKGEVASVRIHY